MEKPSINDLPDDLLLEILTWLPTFKEIPATMIVSKRWEGVWKLMQDLKFDDESCTSVMSFTSFVNGCLLKKKNNNDCADDQVIIERLHLKLGRNYPASDINAWVQAAVNRSVRELKIDLIGKSLELLPTSCCLSTCTTLKTLILRDLSIEVIPSWFRLPSLKTLEILRVRFLCDESAASTFLQICPVLEYLVVAQTKVFKTSHNESSLSSSTCTSLKRLILYGLNIDLVPTWFSLPSLKTLELTSVKFRGQDSAASLAQNWPSIEWLAVNKTKVFNSIMRTGITLTLLILKELSIEFVPPEFRMPSLRTLRLLSVRFSGEECVAALLKSFQALEVLVINKTEDDNVMIFNISVHSLRSLSIDNSKGKRGGGYVKAGINHGFLIDTPLLRMLNFRDTFSNFIEFEYMPQLIKADIEVIRGQFENKFMGISFTSVEELSLCSPSSKTPYPRDTVFDCLISVELCTCSSGWWSLLADILTDSPYLRSLKLKSQHSARCPLEKKEKRHRARYKHDWPICLSSTKLEILEWRQYEGTEQEMKVASCILANATRLKMATFSPRFRNKYNNMCRKLQKLHRVSNSTTQLMLEQLT